MEFYRLTIPIPKQPWLWIRFRIGTVLLLVAILAILLAWRRSHGQLAAEVLRLKTPHPHYEAAQATGQPNVTQRGDSSHAWCPATMDAGTEWLLLDYDTPIMPTAIVVHENYDPGAVMRITHYSPLGQETTLWQGAYTPTTGVSGSVAMLPIPAATSVKTSRIKVYLDTAAATGWQEIDAVDLIDASGTVHWASGAQASTTWGESQTSVPLQSNCALQR